MIRTIKHVILLGLGFIGGWLVGTIVFFIAVAEHYRSIERGRYDSQGRAFKVRMARRIRR